MKPSAKQPAAPDAKKPRSEKERKAARKLSRPPRDDRAITIAPGAGPDVTLG